MPPSPPIISPDELQPKAYKKYVAASARLYTKFSDDEQWSFTNHKGVIVFGRDRSNLVGGEVSSIGHGTTKSEVHWFRLISAGVTVWTFRIPRQFDYMLDKPFFHTFTGYVSSTLFIFPLPPNCALLASSAHSPSA
jgi:neural Wiskott-Aldrich syndrome protein